MANKIYAWVSSETCTNRRAVRCGERAGRNDELVSRHGDYNPWLYSKRETLAIIASGCADARNYYRVQMARLVSELLDWAY